MTGTDVAAATTRPATITISMKRNLALVREMRGPPEHALS